MKNSTLVLGIIAAGCASAAVYLGVELNAARAELEQETLARSADQAHIRELEEARHRLDAVEPGPQLTAGSAPAAIPATRQQPADPAIPTSTPPEPRFGNKGKFDNSPAARNERRLQTEIRLRRFYSDMPAELGLDTDQANKLFDILADSRMATANGTRGYYGDPAGASSIEAAEREQRNAAISALLGPEKAAEFQSYEQSIPARMQVNRIGENLAAANFPLSDSQRQSLIKVVGTEFGAKPEPQPPDGNSDRAAYQLSLLDWQEDYLRRVQPGVEALLTPDQLTRYREEIEAQNARMAASRARAEARRNRTN